MKLHISFSYFRLLTPYDNNTLNNKSKIRRRTAAPAELLFGLHTDSNLMAKSQDLSFLGVGNALQRVPSVPGSLK